MHTAIAANAARLSGRTAAVHRLIRPSTSAWPRVRTYSQHHEAASSSRSPNTTPTPAATTPSHASHRPTPDTVSTAAGESSTFDPSERAAGSGASNSDRGQGGAAKGRGGQATTTLYILATAAVLVAGNHYLLPSPNAATNAARANLKLEPRSYNTLPLTATAFYPAPTDATSQHKHLQILLPPNSSRDATSSASASELDKLRIRSVYLKEPALQIERAYTPLYDTLPGTAASLPPSSHIDLIIKRYADGELGRYAHRLAPGHSVEVRGPVETWSYAAHVADRDGQGSSATAMTPTRGPDEIVLLVGGTGITPAYQLLTSLLGRPRTPSTTASSGAAPPTLAGRSGGGTKLTLLYAVPNLKSALLLPQLHALASSHPDRLQVGIFAESLDTSGAASSPSAPSELYQPTLDGGAVTTRLEVTRHRAAAGQGGWYRRPLAAVSQLFASSPAPTPSTGVVGATERATMQRWEHAALSPSHLLTPAPAGNEPGGRALPLYTSRITPDHIRALAPPSPSSEGGGEEGTVVLVCGPDGMVHALAGPKARDGVAQGPLNGVLARLGYKREQVWKL